MVILEMFICLAMCGRWSENIAWTGLYGVPFDPLAF